MIIGGPRGGAADMIVRLGLDTGSAIGAMREFASCKEPKLALAEIIGPPLQQQEQ
jgi:hypothetical protein